MAYAFDPEILAVIMAALAETGPPAPIPAGDWQTLRRDVDARLIALGSMSPAYPDVSFTSHETAAADGSTLALRWYQKSGAAPGSAVLYLHGGGMVCGTVDIYDPVVAAYVSATGVPMLAVEYRLAPEHPHPTPVEDCFAGLVWLFENAARFGADPARIAVMGDSAGGGLAAGLALLARDRGLTLAKQILIYPMLDDGNIVPDPSLAPFATWNYDNNITGWGAYLANEFGGSNVSVYAAPTRATNLAGLAPAYVEVGELDIFRDEDIEYARRIGAAGISVELHVHPGAPHAFERIAPASAVAQRAMADRLRVLKGL